uniref:Uncharacterized protein n=1 Tax=Strigamia maritima TaxID=126957 RepID=T1J363_STRMM
MTKISSAGCARNDLIVEHDFNVRDVGNAGRDLTVGHNFNVIGGETTVIAIPINCNCNWCNDCQITLNCNTDGAETLLGIILAVRQYQDLGLKLNYC